jgi:hypothetical protein
VSGLHERLEAAIGAQLPVTWERSGKPPPVWVRDALVAGLQVLADELGPRPDDEAPPVRELPTERGAVIIATHLCGDLLDAPRAAVLIPDDGDDGVPWRVGVPGGAAGDSSWWAAEDITGWVPALVVRADDEGPVAALREIEAFPFDRKIPFDERVDHLRELARRALARLDGGGRG